MLEFQKTKINKPQIHYSFSSLFVLKISSSQLDKIRYLSWTCGPLVVSFGHFVAA